MYGSPDPVVDADVYMEVYMSIMEKLMIPRNSLGSVKETLINIRAQELGGKRYDPNLKLHDRGCNAYIRDMTSTSKVLYYEMSRDMTVTQATFTLNLHLANTNQPIISRSTVQCFLRRSPMVIISARKSSKTGKTDPISAWAVCRLVFANQLNEMLRLGSLDWHNPEVAGEIARSPFRPLYLNAMASWDEKHLKQKVGKHTKLEYRVFQDANKNFCRPEDGGELPPHETKVTLKFEEEARGLFGCAVKGA